MVYVLKIGLMGLERNNDRFDVWRSVIWDLVRNIRSIEHAQLLSWCWLLGLERKNDRFNAWRSVIWDY